MAKRIRTESDTATAVELQAVSDLLAFVEGIERTILTALGCSHDLDVVRAILKGEQPAPWLEEHAARDRDRAKQAMNALKQIYEVRHHLQPPNENPRLAAHAALLAGLWANDAAARAALVDQARAARQKGGRVRGAQLTDDASKHDATIRKYARQWRDSDELQEQYRTAASFISHKTGRSVRTSQRAIKRLTSRDSS
jgi:hypothetical protein